MTNVLSKAARLDPMRCNKKYTKKSERHLQTFPMQPLHYFAFKACDPQKEAFGPTLLKRRGIRNPKNEDDVQNDSCSLFQA